MICKSVFLFTLSIVCFSIKLHFESWIFLCVQLKRERSETLTVGPSGWASLTPRFWADRISVFFVFTWRWIGFQNWNMYGGRSPEKSLLHHHQKPLDFTYITGLDDHHCKCFIFLSCTCTSIVSLFDSHWVSFFQS